MSLHYLVDGYNLLYALPELPAGSLEQKRAALVRLLQRERPHGRSSLTIVFDSRQGMGDTLSQEGLTLIYTAGETADDWISRNVRGITNPRNHVVVTDDQGLRRLVGGTGVKWLSTKDFLKNALPDSPERRTPTGRPPPLDAITEELKKKWLE